MIKKLFNLVFQPSESTYLDAKIWIQKILLEEKFKKINS